LTKHMMRLSGVALLPLLLLPISLLLSGCGSIDFSLPRHATATALAAVPPTVTPETIVLGEEQSIAIAEDALNTPTSGRLGNGQSISVWIIDESSDELLALNQVAEAFMEATGIDVATTLVNPERVTELLENVLKSEELPDLIIHPIDYSFEWHRRGILDGDLASRVAAALGRESFAPTAIQLASLRPAQPGSPLVALPLSGWPQLVIYRSDWLEAFGLPAPGSYPAMLSAAAAVTEQKPDSFGFVAATEGSHSDTQRVFEHVAIANGCQLVQPDSKVSLRTDECGEALQFYSDLIGQYSPLGVQTDVSAISAYLSGRAGIVMLPSRYLSLIAATDGELAPSCAECDFAGYLASNSGLSTTLRGDGALAVEASFGQVNVVGATVAAQKDIASDFMTFLLGDGYRLWLSSSPATRIPLRLASSDGTTDFAALWSGLPLVEGGATLDEAFGPGTAAGLAEAVSNSLRWGFASGRGDLMGRLVEEVTLSPLLQEMLGGYFTPERMLVKINQAIVALDEPGAE